MGRLEGIGDPAQARRQAIKVGKPSTPHDVAKIDPIYTGRLAEIARLSRPSSKNTWDAR